MSLRNSVKEKIKQGSSFWKGALILFLIMLLMIPMGMVNDLMRERQYRSKDVANEISQQWSGQQSLVGPVMTVKYRHYYGKEGKYYVKKFHVMPEKLVMDVNLEPEERYRGLFKTVVYIAKGQVRGTFNLSELQNKLDENMSIDSLLVSVGVSDKRGLNEAVKFNISGIEHAMSWIKATGVFNSGIETRLDPSLLGKNKQSLDFDMNINLKGSQAFSTLPIAGETAVNMSSSWESPSFFGSFLPVTRDISEQGFTSNWNVLAMNHSMPSIWEEGTLQLASSSSVSSYAAEGVYDTAYTVKSKKSYASSLGGNDEALGVKLVIPANAYQQSERSSKYGLLFIALTFLTFFVAEVMNKNRVHPLQYLLIGMSLVMFYTLLLSFSEHFGFGLAYLIASIAVTLLISGYAKAILKSNRLAKVVFGLLAGLYAYLYVLLQLESYALLMGSVGLFLILAAVMYFTRNVDWYQGGATDSIQKDAVAV